MNFQTKKRSKKVYKGYFFGSKVESSETHCRLDELLGVFSSKAYKLAFDLFVLFRGRVLSFHAPKMVES